METPLLKLILEGRSIIDCSRLFFKDPQETKDFLKVNEFDVSRVKDLQRLQNIHNEALTYLKRELNYEVAEVLQDPSKILDFFSFASNFDDRKLQSQACSLLKAMNIINHIDGRELLYHCPISLRDLFSLAEDKIERTLSGLLRSTALPEPPLLRYQGGRKPKESLITKLLCKRETIAAQIYDRVRYRIVTRTRADISVVLEYLFRTVLPFNYVIPGASVNQLVGVKGKSLSSKVANFKKAFADSSKTMEYSGRNYKVCKFVVDIPVRLDNFLAQTGGTVYRDSLGSIAYVLMEFQIIDQATEKTNNTGESSHENYKARQKEGVLRRLAGKSS